MNMIASLFIVASFVATSYGYGEACAALNVPSGVCAPLGSCPPNTARGAPILTSLVNTCPDANAICCSTEISPFDFSYRGPCVGVSIPDGTCKGLLQSCQYGLLTGIVGTCPLGAYCCGAVQVIGKEEHFIHAQKFQHSKAQSVQSPLTIVDGVIYAVNITIGTPPQQFLVALDADSSDLIIPASSVNNNGITYTNTTFNSSASSTYQFIGNVTNNGQGFVIGQDTVKLGGIGTSQITIPKTRFLLDTNANSFFYYDLGINGVLGIAFESLSMTGGAPPLINAINQGLLSQPILTTYLKGQPNEDNLTTGAGGNVVFGGVNTKNCGSSITYHPLSSASYFQITLSGISVGNYSISKRYQATVNFEQAILGPLNVLDAIANQVGATPTDVEGITYYAIDCNATIPSLNLKIGSNTYSIDEKNLIWNPYDFNDLCFLRLYSMDNGGFGPSWVLGLPLIQQYCTVFDLGNKRIGFSPVKNQ